MVNIFKHKNKVKCKTIAGISSVNAKNLAILRTRFDINKINYDRSREFKSFERFVSKTKHDVE